MKILVVYDSTYGNTEKLATAMAAEIKGKAIQVSNIKNEELMKAELLIFGSPTHGGRPTDEMNLFLLNKLPDSGLENVRMATFDTRMGANEHGLFLKWLMKTIGYAAEKMADVLKNKGVKSIEIESFIVEGKEGPLKEGEMERALKWVQRLARSK